MTSAAASDPTTGAADSARPGAAAETSDRTAPGTAAESSDRTASGTAAESSDRAAAETVERAGTGSGRRRGWDRSTRWAAVVAALVAVPVTVAAAGLMFFAFSPDDAAAPQTAPDPGIQQLGPKLTVPVEMDAPPLAERPATVCRALLAKLPSTIRNLPQRPVTAGPEQNAAYGEPALTVACGVDKPEVPPTATVWGVERVCWYAEEGTDATVLTSLDREVAVRVTVPKTYEQPLQWVSQISESIVASILTAGPAPSGCRG